MAEVTLSFVNGGQPFKPKLYPQDLANYDEAELAILEKANAPEATPLERAKARHGILLLQRDFVVTVLGKTFPGQVDTDLTVADLREAFMELYVKGQAWPGSAERPLGHGGRPSPPSPSPA